MPWAFTWGIINKSLSLPTMHDYWDECCQHSTATYPYNENDDTVPLRYNETGYEHFYSYSILDGLLIWNNSYYGLGDGFLYFVGSASSTSRLGRPGLTHMSDAWKEHMLTHYEPKKPDRLINPASFPWINTFASSARFQIWFENTEVTLNIIILNNHDRMHYTTRQCTRCISCKNQACKILRRES